MNIGIETENIEFKKSTSELKEGLISLSSMLNKHGYGTLYFGIKDNGDVIGQQIGDKTLRDISQAIANNIKPQLIPTIVLELFDNKNIIKVQVNGSNKPYSAFGKYYIRTADEDRELSPEQLRDLMLKREEADLIVKIKSSYKNLTFNQLKTFYISKGLTINSESFEKNLGLFQNDHDYNLMAELLADKNDISIKVATFSGTNKSQLIKRNEYGFKCLLTAMEQVINYVESLNDTKVSLGGHQRQELQLFDISCFREAWINACLHSSWEKLNPPAVYIFSDRIEIISTGGLPQDLSVDEFYRGISRPINQKLQKIFGQLGYVEQTGHGIPLIINNYGKQAFEIMDNYLNVIIPFTKSMVAERTAKISNQQMNSSQQLIYNLLNNHPEYTIKDLVRETNISDGYVRKIINNLKTAGYLERIGSNKNGRWKVNL